MKNIYLLLSSLFLASTSTMAMADADIERLSTPAFKALNLPFSQAVKVGDMLYLSGELGVKPGTLELIEGGVKPQTQQALENIKTTLQHFGSDMDKVIKCTLFLADIKEWGMVNEVYVTYFNDKLPARSAVAGSGLGLGARVEIECMALAGSAD
ncbi:Rid family detoxifying hydrolase [uncultured Paraglaciecola sp.]|uniref:Rid family detoxifying hydrolase n=1 Tax=uncultured Paraglaciecola sp. TaxID=1765024 RepID=UPI00260C3D99|nr:Rid family detoxifying hydrolase [uncultured Paraglaciecola sp.]